MDTRYKIQKLLKAFKNPLLDNEFNHHRPSSYTPFFTFYKMYYNEYFHTPEKYFMEKVYYGFSLLALRTLSEEEKNLLNSCHTNMLKFFPCKKSDFKPENENPEDPEDPVLTIFLMSIEQNFNYSYNKANEKFNSQDANYNVLYNVLLDTTLNEITYYCIGKLYIECSKNTMTYKELIENYLFSQDNDILPENTKEAIYEKEEDSLRTHIKKFIFPNDDEETYYRSFRGKSKIKNHTFSLCEKDVYNLIYIFYQRRSPRPGKTGVPSLRKEVLDCYYKKVFKNFCEEYNIKNLQEDKLLKLSKGYKLYIDYIVSHKEQRITSSLIKDCDYMKQFHNIINNVLSPKNNTWYNMTSIFIAPWDFVQTAAYVYSN